MWFVEESGKVFLRIKLCCMLFIRYCLDFLVVICYGIMIIFRLIWKGCVGVLSRLVVLRKGLWKSDFFCILIFCLGMINILIEMSWYKMLLFFYFCLLLIDSRKINEKKRWYLKLDFLKWIMFLRIVFSFKFFKYVIYFFFFIYIYWSWVGVFSSLLKISYWYFLKFFFL